MAKTTWRAKCRCMMPWRDYECGETVELDEGDARLDDERFRTLFERVDGPPADEPQDPSYNVMVQRLRQAKITIPKGSTRDQVRELFRKFLADGELPAAR